MTSNPVFTEGFDMYNGVGVNTGLQAFWLANPFGMSSWVVTSSMVTGRFGGQALRITDAGTPGASQYSALYGRPLAATYTSLTWCAALRCPTLSAVYAPFFNLYCTGAGGGMQLTGLVTSLGEINIYNGQWGTLLGQSAPSTILANTWNFLEIEVVCHPTAGRVTIYLNGNYITPILNVTGVNTNPQTTPGVNYLVLGGIGHAFGGSVAHIAYDVDDLFILDSAAHLEDCWIETLRTAANSTVGNWTANTGAEWDALNDTTVDGDTTYLYTATVGAKDLFTVTPLSNTPLHIYGVQPVWFAEKTDATARSMTVSLTSGATVQDGTAQFMGAAYARYNRGIELVDPATGVAWTPTGVNSLLIGPKLVS